MAAFVRRQLVPICVLAVMIPVWASLDQLSSWSNMGPGAGLLPKVVTALVALLALLALVAPAIEAAPEERSDQRVFFLYAGALIAIPALFPLLGFVLPMIVASFTILWAAERKPFARSLVYAVGMTLTLTLIFSVAFGITLPDGPVEAVVKYIFQEVSF